jgi:hypothetical protein
MTRRVSGRTLSSPPRCQYRRCWSRLDRSCRTKHDPLGLAVRLPPRAVVPAASIRPDHTIQPTAPIPRHHLHCTTRNAARQSDNFSYYWKWRSKGELISYTAPDWNWNDFGNVSSDEMLGRQELDGRIRAVVSGCPTQGIVLAGYSFGAWIIDDWLSRPENSGLLQNIAAVELCSSRTVR